MKRRRYKLGQTLVELIIYTALTALLAIGAGMGYTYWQASANARSAAASLRTVMAAQRQWQIRNPGSAISSLTTTTLAPYLPNTALPTLPSVSGGALSFNITVFPPIITQGGSTYDPSGSSSDGLWDVGANY